MTKRAPIIGITSADRSEELASTVWYKENYSVPAEYVDAVRRAGGNPVMLPPGESDWSRWLEFVDGVIVTGGADVDSRLYGGDPDHPKQQAPLVDRDETELALTRHLVATEIPTLFVCRGLQVLNVAMGGTLNQHLADTLEEDMHRLDGDGWAYHDSEIKRGSLLAEAMGVAVAKGASGHHQSIDRLGEGLVPVAWAADGVIEGAEVAGAAWLVGVQWHPEVTAACDPTQQGLFDALVAAVDR
mgnify:CR=1 FL=1